MLMYFLVHSGLLVPSLGLAPFGASLRLLKIVPDDFIAAVCLALPALVAFLIQFLTRVSFTGASHLQNDMHGTQRRLSSLEPSTVGFQVIVRQYDSQIRTPGEAVDRRSG